MDKITVRFSQAIWIIKHWLFYRQMCRTGVGADVRLFTYCPSAGIMVLI